MFKFLATFFWLSFCLLSINLAAQRAGDQVFTESIHEVHFQFEQSNYWSQMDNNIANNLGGDIPYIMGSVSIDGLLLDSVGVRFKGFTSYLPGENKQPIKIDFNEYISGQKYDGLRKLNLNNGFGDPAMQRDLLCYDILRSMGVSAPRTSWARVYMNDEYLGFYLVVEQVDRAFLKNNFKNKDGNLFKNKGWSYLEWLGNEKPAYDEIFDLKTNQDEDDWSGFINLMDLINNSNDAEFEQNIGTYLSVENFLKVLAVDVATNNWDSFMEHGRNWYMYEDTISQQFHWIPWDYNFALGGSFDFVSDDCFVFADFAYFSNGTSMVEFSDLSFAAGDLQYLWDFGDGNTSTLQSPSHTYEEAGIYIVQLTIMIDENCQSTFSKVIDTNTNPSDCASVINGSFARDVDVVFQHVVELMPSCCDEWTEDCEDYYSFIYDFINSELVSSISLPIDQTENQRPLINRLLAIPEYRNLYYSQFCSLINYSLSSDRVEQIIDKHDALISEEILMDPNYLYSIGRYDLDLGKTDPDVGLKAYLADRLDVLIESLPDYYNCPTPSTIGFSDVVINELVAVNDSLGGEQDPDGGYPDWIEIYNNTNEPLDLTGVFISDKQDNLSKWSFPEGTIIEPDRYIILWADNDEDQEGLHVNFKLSKEGESLYLSNPDGTAIDSLTYPEQESNIAWARVPNGSGDFRSYTTTIGRNNEEGMSSINGLTQMAALQLYPNPSSHTLWLHVQDEQWIPGGTVKIYSSAGQEVLMTDMMNKELKIDVMDLPSGIYTLNYTLAHGIKINHKVVILH